MMDYKKKSASDGLEGQKADGKVKEEVQQMETDGDGSLVYASKTGTLVGPEAYSKSVTEYLTCQVCKMTMKTVKTAVLHYKGRNHAKVLKQIAAKLGEKNIPLLTESKTTDGITADEIQTETANIDEEALKEYGELADYVYVDGQGQLWGPEKRFTNLEEFKNCLLCKVNTSSFKTASSHYNGMKHVRNLTRVAQLKGLVVKTVGKNTFSDIENDSAVKGQDDSLGEVQSYSDTSGKRKGDSPGGKAKKQKKEESVCDICSITLSSETHAQMHYNGKKHKRKVAKEQTNDTSTKDRGGDSTGDKAKKQKTEEVYCELCNITLSTETHAQMHYDGKKHQRKSRAQWTNENCSTKERGDGSQKITLDLVGAGILFCPTCDVLCLSTDQLSAHYSGVKHKNKVEAEIEILEKEKETAEGATKTDENQQKQQPMVYKCSICASALNSKQQYIQHVESNKHKKKYALQHEKKLKDQLEKTKKKNPSTEGRRNFSQRGRGGGGGGGGGQGQGWKQKQLWNRPWSQRQGGWGTQSQGYSQPWKGGNNRYGAAYSGNAYDWKYGEVAYRGGRSMLGQDTRVGRGRGYSMARGNQAGSRGVRGQRNNYSNSYSTQMGGQGQGSATNRAGSYARGGVGNSRDGAVSAMDVDANGEGSGTARDGSGYRGGYSSGQTTDAYNYGTDDTTYSGSAVVSGNSDDWSAASAVLNNLPHDTIMGLAAQALKVMNKTPEVGTTTEKQSAIEWANDPDYQTYVKGQNNTGANVSYQGRASGDIRKQWSDTSGTNQSWGTGRSDYMV